MIHRLVAQRKLSPVALLVVLAGCSSGGGGNAGYSSFNLNPSPSPSSSAAPGPFVPQFLEKINVPSGNTGVRPRTVDEQHGVTDVRIGPDGRFVVFISRQSDLVTGDTNDWTDLFLRDRDSHLTTRVSTDSSGNQLPNGVIFSCQAMISDDRRWVAYEDATNRKQEMTLKDLSNNATLVIGEGTLTDLSRDGRYVGYIQPSGPGSHAFVYDRVANQTTQLDVGGNGVATQVHFSPDGTRALFVSASSNLVTPDNNNSLDVFLYNLVTPGPLVRVSSKANGQLATGASMFPWCTADNRFVVFSSEAPLVTEDTHPGSDVYVKDLQSGSVLLLSRGIGGAVANGFSEFPSISDDGRRVCFTSTANNLVANDTNGERDVFVVDVPSRTVGRVNLTDTNREPTGSTTGYSIISRISADGRWVAFLSAATNMVQGQSDGDIVNAYVTRADIPTLVTGP